MSRDAGNWSSLFFFLSGFGGSGAGPEAEAVIAGLEDVAVVGNQINRYQRHSFWSARGLFNYVQIFVISNGVNTKYYANQRRQSFKQTFFWANKDNTLITQLDQFADAFLEKCHVSKMISRYIVLQQTDKILMVLRPYQFYAVEAIVDQVKTSRNNAYIWHTTGSGKTLTSFKAAQILTGLPKIVKVVFVVDRADLDYQTTREFNHFSKGSVDGTSNTKALVAQFGDETKLIVTTIQKLNNAIQNDRYDKTMSALKNERIVFIFDECHRSQFGETHKRISSMRLRPKKTSPFHRVPVILRAIADRLVYRWPLYSKPSSRVAT